MDRADRGQRCGRQRPATDFPRCADRNLGTTVGAGLVGLKLRDFVTGSAIAALIWAGVPLLLGYVFRANLSDFEAIYHAAMSALPMTLGLLGLAICAYLLFRRPATRIRMRTALRIS